jgi:hypothetical protein
MAEASLSVTIKESVAYEIYEHVPSRIPARRDLRNINVVCLSEALA